MTDDELEETEHDDEESEEEGEESEEEPEDGEEVIVQDDPKTAWGASLRDDVVEGFLAGGNPDKIQAESKKTEPKQQPQRVKEANQEVSKEKPMGKRDMRQAIPDIPVLEVDKQLDKGISHASFNIKRRTQAGQVHTILPRGIFELRWLKSGEFEGWLQDWAGGGDYIIEVRDPNTDEQILPRFRIGLLGMMKDPQRNIATGGSFYAPGSGLMPGAAPAPFAPGVPRGTPGLAHAGVTVGPPMPVQLGPHGFPTQPVLGSALPPGTPQPMLMPDGQLNLPPQHEIPAIYRTAPAVDQWNIYLQRQAQVAQAQTVLPPGASIHSDQLAMGFSHQLHAQLAAERAENAKLRTKLESDKASFDDKLTKMAETVADLKKSIVEERSTSELRVLRSEIAAMKERPAAKQVDFNGIAAIAMAVAPVLVQFVKGSQDSTLAQMKMSQEQTSAILAVTNKPPDKTDWKVLVPALAPFALKLFEQYSPAAQLETKTAQMELNMTLLKQIHDLVIAQAGDPPPAWLPIAQGVLEAIQEGIAGGFGGGGAPKRLPGGAPASLPLPQGAQNHENDQQVWESLAQINPQAADATRMVWQQVPRDFGFHTHEWRMLLFNFHNQLGVEEMAQELAIHLAQCSKFNLLPRPFAGVFTETRPSVEAVVQRLPIWQMNESYARQVIDKLVDLIVEMRGGEESKPAPAGRTIIDLGSHGNGSADEEESDEADEDKEEAEEARS